MCFSQLVLLGELMDYSNYFSHLCFENGPGCPILMLINGAPGASRQPMCAGRVAKNAKALSVA